MCGIAGAFSVQGPDIEAMVAAMAHRGPDDRGIFRSASCVLGMTRLAIIDTSPAGHQPMVRCENDVALVFNGEIYNHKQLRAELEAKGRRFSSTSDTEVILNLYLEIGDACVSRLRGMFAIAIYDRRDGPGREKLLLARDHLGIKPLLFSRIGDGIVFASEIKALVCSGVVKPKLDANSVRQLLSRGAVCQPSTILYGVEMLMPGHALTISRAGIQTSCFWQPGAERRRDIANASYADQVCAVRDELERIVTEQMVADVPVGAFLSGGLDSSLLVAMMAAAKSDPIQTFSVGFGEEGNTLDECADAALVADHLGTAHTRVQVGEDDIFNGLADFITALDQPSVDGLNSWVVSGVASQHVKVAVSGTGGDELFAGYPWFRAMRDYCVEPGASWGDWVERLMPALGRINARLGAQAEALLPQGFVTRFGQQYRHFDPARAGAHLGRPAEAMQRADIADLRRADLLPSGRALDRTSALCLGSYTLNQLLRDIDATSMAHSLEVRVPFLDPDLADLALSLPEEARLGEGQQTSAPDSYRALGTKRILLDIAEDLLPADLATRPKRGFSMPLGLWLGGKLRPVLEDVVRSPCDTVAALIDQQEASQTVDRFLRGEVHWGQPWLLMVLDLWWRSLNETYGRVTRSARDIRPSLDIGASLNG